MTALALAATLIAATPSSLGFGGGDVLMPNRWARVYDNPSAILWSDRYMASGGLMQTWETGHTEAAVGGADPGNGPLAAAFGARYVFRGGVEDLQGIDGGIAVRLGEKLGVGFSGVYDSDGSFGGWRAGATVPLWQGRTPLLPRLIAGIDHRFDEALVASQRWRVALLLRDLADQVVVSASLRPDGSGASALRWMTGQAQIGGGLSWIGDGEVSEYGVTLRWLDKVSWIGLGWSHQRAQNNHQISFEMALPMRIGRRGR
jgi:hypothetical protein